MNFGSSLSKFCLFAFFVLSTISLQGQVVLNELYIRPDGSTATPPNGLIYSGSKEYIELYNKGCSSVDISGYYIGMKTNYGPQGGVIRIPNGTSILPGAHFVIGSAAPGGFVAGNIDLGLGAANAASYCVIGSGIRIINLDGWIALYNASGTPIDLVYWSGAASNITAAANDFDFNPSMPLCNPASGTPPTALINAKQIFTAYNTSNPSLINYIPTQGPVIAYRTTDGANTWSFVANYTNDAALGATINKSIANGNCNGGTCVTPPLPAAPTVTSPIIYCQGATATPLTATATAGGVLNWWGTNATGGTSSATAPTPSTLTAVTTTYYVSQTVGGCESIRSAIVVTVNASLSPALSCGTNTLNSVVFNWGFVSGATGYNLSYQINSNPIVVVGPITNVNTYPFTGLASNSSVTITLTPTGPAGLCFNSATLSCSTLAPTDCSSCSAPSCPIIGVANYPVRNFSATSCNTWLPSLTNTTIKSFYLVQSDANGFVGLVQQAGGSPALCITRTAVLRPLASSCSIAANVNPSVLNSNGVASGFNPEWYGLTPNTAYVIEVTITLGVGCTLDSLCSNYYGCSIPASPTASVTIQPTCTTPSGTIVVSAPIGASNLYSIDGITYQSSPTFSGLAPNNYIVTVKKTPTGCTSNGTALTINAVPSIATPTASATVQPSCTTPTGTIVISSPTGANLEYSVNGTTYQASASFSGLAPANYNVTVRNTTNGCVSTATAVTINAVPSIATPTASVTVQPTCTTPTGTIVITAPTGANLEYSVNGTTYQASTSFSLLAPASYNVTVRNTTNGCVSTATAVTINAVPSIATPTASATVQPSCTTPTGSIVITAPTGANLEYSVNGTTYQASASFSGLAPANYNVTVRNTSNGCVSTATAITINALPPTIIPVFTPISPVCAGSTITLPITSINGITGSWTPNFDPIHTVTYSFTPNAGQCATNTSLVVQVNPLPNPSLVSGKICVNASGIATIPYRLNTGLNNSNYTFQWNIDGVLQTTTSNYFDAIVGGNYSVIATDIASSCSSAIVSANVTAISTATNFTATIANSTLSNTNTIIATVSGGSGAYLFALDNFEYQSSPIFANVSPGPHTISILDPDGCAVFNPIDIIAIGYPYFFTPNQDGFNDTWNVIGLEDQDSAKVYIFDRYGKLLKQLSTQGNGWDGTYNNHEMPSTDYWFSLEYNDNGTNKKFGSHFSLKR